MVRGERERARELVKTGGIIQADPKDFEGGRGYDVFGPPGMPEEIRKRIRGGAKRTKSEVTPLKHPMCMDNRQFETGITCKPVNGQPSTTVSVPAQPRDYPAVVQCAPYVAPKHGSVWYKGKQYDVATKTGVPERDHVTIACDDYYRLSDRGSTWPECLHSGQWDNGKTCEPIMCPPYVAPAHGWVDVRTPVHAGTRVTITCDAFFGVFGLNAGATCTPLCKEDGTYEKGCICVPRPCPKRTKSLPPAQGCFEGIQVHPQSKVKISHKQIKDWEDDLKHTMFDYNPNVFDQEPRPYQLPAANP